MNQERNKASLKPETILAKVAGQHYRFTGNAIFVAGIPDKPGSLPHSERGREL
jgi:hypothetical protein